MYKRVLLIGENSLAFKELKDLFHDSRDIELIEARGLTEALVKIDWKIDVALLGLTGTTAERSRFIRKLRGTAPYSWIPILACCDSGAELDEADECLPAGMEPARLARRISAHARAHAERTMLLESNSQLRHECEKYRKIHFVTLEYANMIENELMDRIKAQGKPRSAEAPEGPEPGPELELLRAENGKLRLEVEKLDVILSTVISHDTILEDQLDQRLKESAELAHRDPLTQIFNRRKFNEELVKEYSAMGESRRPLSLAMFDVDDFKAVNDRRGHDFGDRVLQGIAACVGAALPERAVFARWGGEEFMMLLPGMDLAAATEVAEALRLAIRRHKASGSLKITCSFGVVQVGEDEEPQCILSRLDSSLYEAKRAGKDCVRSGAAPARRRPVNG
jgi:diguanylate cyclase (GGDEF)-like protein